MAENSFGEPQMAALAAKAWALAPGFAGAVLSLAFVEALTVKGRVLAVLVGLLSAIFLAPAIAAGLDLVWPGPLPEVVARGVLFLTALCAMGTLPPLLGSLKRVAGDPLSLLKVRVGPVGGEGV